MKKIYIPLFAVCVLLISSCSSKIFLPLYNPTPKVETNPYANFIEPRVVPETSIDNLEFTLFEEINPNPKDFANAKHIPIINNSLNPKIAITLPNSISSNDDIEINKNELFKSGIYNEVEQEIELALMHKQYTVVDRVKFESAISEVREKLNSVMDDKIKALLDNNDFESLENELTIKITNGELTKEQSLEYKNEWIENIKRNNGVYKPTDANLSAQILVRIAKDFNSNFVLQINEVSIENIGERKFYIKDLPEVKIFLDKNPELKFGQLPEALPLQINSAWLKAKFSAKLIDVVSGDQVWNGKFEMESINAEPINVFYRVQKFVSNGDLINQAITSYNSELSTLHSQIKENGQSLQSVYNQASYERKFKTKEELEDYTNKLKNSIRDLETKYNSNVSQLNTLNSQPPSEASIAWTYAYLISEPVLDPDISKGTQIDELEEYYKKHKERLISKVVNQLVQTIDLTRP
jgi:predicted  nucleic acid-binding Zn-ribbon protein